MMCFERKIRAAVASCSYAQKSQHVKGDSTSTQSLKGLLYLLSSEFKHWILCFVLKSHSKELFSLSFQDVSQGLKTELNAMLAM